MLALGVPLGPVQAILIAVLVVHGIAPGPLMISQQPQLFWGFIASMYIGNLVLLILNLPLVGVFVSLLRIPYTYLYPVILSCCIVGVYTVNHSMVEVLIMALAGAGGYALRKLRYDVAPIVLGFILAPMLEMAFRQSLAMSGGEYTIFLHRPITVALLAVGLLLLTIGLVPAVMRRRARLKRSGRMKIQRNAEGRRLMRPVTFGLWILVAVSPAVPAQAQAQDKYPSKPVTLLLGYPPGGSTDTTARALAPVLERILSQPVVIQNRPGAAALVGTMQVANATPDGYTITVATTQLSLLPAVDEVFGRPPSFKREQFAPSCAGLGRSVNAVRQRQPALENVPGVDRRCQEAAGPDRLCLRRALRHHTSRDRDRAEGDRHTHAPSADRRRRTGADRGAWQSRGASRRAPRCRRPTGARRHVAPDRHHGHQAGRGLPRYPDP